MSYRLDLKRNRDAFMAELTRKYGVLPAPVIKAYIAKIIAIQNETRGKIGELIGEVALTAANEAVESDILRDRKTFETPFGIRRIDVWDARHRRAVEVKSGFSCKSKMILNQIEKDLYLRETGQINRLEWRLLQGGSAPLRAYLDQKKIDYALGWPEIGALPPKLHDEALLPRALGADELR